MTEYWKSQPRRFCEICKCWFGDNKASIQHHEQGVRHQNNVQKRIRESRQKSREQQEQMKNKSQTLRDMEMAALRAYEKDLASDPTRGHDSAVRDAIQRRKRTFAAGVTSNSTQWSGAAAAAAYFTNPQPVPLYADTAGKVTGKVVRVAATSEAYNSTQSDTSENAVSGGHGEEEETGQWVQGLSPEGYTYYYNTSTGESTFEKPVGFVEPPNDQADSRGESSTEETKANEKKQEESATEVKETDVTDPDHPQDKGWRKQQHKRADPYGSWTTVKVCDPAATSLEDDAGDASSGADIDDDDDSDDFKFREKAYPSDSVRPIHIASQAKQDGAPAFKKRKVTAKRAQFRQRTH